MVHLSAALFSHDQVGCEAGIPLEEGREGVLHPQQSPACEVKAVRVERVVSTDCVDKQPLEAAEILTHVLSLGVAHEPLTDALLQILQHTHGWTLLQCLSQAKINVHESILRLKVLLTHLSSVYLSCHLLFVVISWFLIVDELIQKLIVLHVDEVHEAALGLLNDVGVQHILLINTIHAQQQHLIVTPVTISSQHTLYQAARTICRTQQLS